MLKIDFKKDYEAFLQSYLKPHYFHDPFRKQNWYQAVAFSMMSARFNLFVDFKKYCVLHFTV